MAFLYQFSCFGLMVVLMHLMGDSVSAQGAGPQGKDWDPVTGRMRTTRPAGSASNGIPRASAGKPLAAGITGAWTRLNATGDLPPARNAYVMTPGPGNTCLMFGGYEDVNIFNDTYQIGTDGRWKRIAATGALPSPRFSAAGIYDAVGSQLVVYGGTSNARFHYNDTYALDLRTNTWRQLNTTGTVPSGRRNHAAIYDPLRRRMIVYGGTDSPEGTTVFSDLYALDLATSAWSPLVPTAGTLPGRRAAAAAYVPCRDAVAIFGGEDENDTYYNDIHYYAFSDGRVTRLNTTGTAHPAVIGATAFYDAPSYSMVIYGGLTPSYDRGGISAVDVNSGQWTSLNLGQPEPDPRHWMQMQPIMAPDQYFLFGGLTTQGNSNESWILTLGERVPVTLSHFAVQ